MLDVVRAGISVGCFYRMGTKLRLVSKYSSSFNLKDSTAQPTVRLGCG